MAGVQGRAKVLTCRMLRLYFGGGQPRGKGRLLPGGGGASSTENTKGKLMGQHKVNRKEVLERGGEKVFVCGAIRGKSERENGWGV